MPVARRTSPFSGIVSQVHASQHAILVLLKDFPYFEVMRPSAYSRMDMSVSLLTSALSDRYRIERELGAGGMATVYLAHDIKHERKVAVKVLKPELATVIGAARFLAEIRTTANLQHPHILPLHDSGEVNGTVYYVMPFVDGETLRDRRSAVESHRNAGTDSVSQI